jgi:MHS family proline/betaine transporter-like MFS transporter
MMEHSNSHGRGLGASWQQSSQAATLLLGTVIGASVTGLMTKEALEAWGWRVPFAAGLLIVPIGFYIRRQIEETPAFLALDRAQQRNPLAQLLHDHGRQVIAGLGLVIVWTVSTYFFLIYMPTYASRQLHLPQTSSLVANGMALATLMLLAPVFGWLSDRIGRKPLLLTGALAICVTSYPLIALLARWPSLPALVMVQMVIAIFIAVFTGPAPAALGELYPTNVRSSGMSLAYNIAVAVFGGFAPFISTWLIAKTGDTLAPAYYVTASAVLSLMALLFMKETAPVRTRS